MLRSMCTCLMVLVVGLLLYSSNTTAQEVLISTNTTGCGHTQDVMSLFCSTIGNKITQIRIIYIQATHRPNCPLAPDTEGCGKALSTTDSYYTSLVEECQNKTSCKYTARQQNIPSCANNIVWGNFITIYFDCVAYGATVPPNPATITSTLLSSSASFMSNSADNERITSISRASTNSTEPSMGTKPLGSSNNRLVHILAPLICCLVILILIIAFIFSYRRKLLPSKLQHAVEKKVFRAKLRAVDAKIAMYNRTQQSKNRQLKTSAASEPAVKMSSVTENDDEDVYSTVDDSTAAYRPWSSESSKSVVNAHLPQVLTVPAAVEAQTGVVNDAFSEGGDTCSWGDSEFDDSDIEHDTDKAVKPSITKEKPRIPVKSTAYGETTRNPVSSYNRTNSLDFNTNMRVTTNHQNRQSNGHSTQAENCRQQSNITVNDDDTYYTCANSRLSSSPEDNSCYYSTGADPENQYYSTAADYDQAQPV